MSFFKKFTKKAKDVAEIAAEKAKDVAELAAEKAKDVKETAQLKMAISSERREMEKNYCAIGQWFASEYEGEMPDAVKDVVAAINDSRSRIAEMEEKLKKEEPVVVVEEAPELKTCPVCGTASNSRFCPDCGASLE